MKRMRDFLRYRLLSLLLLTTLFALWIGVTARRARDQELAAKCLSALGRGKSCLQYDGDLRESIVPAWIRNLVGDHYFQRVIGASIDLPRNEAEYRAAIQYLNRLPSLKRVSVRLRGDYRPPYYDYLTPLARLENLQELELMLLGDQAYAHRDHPPTLAARDMRALKRLSLADAGDHCLPQSWLEFAGRLPSLHRLDIRGTTHNKASDYGLRYLTGSSLRELSLTSPVLLDDELRVFAALDSLCMLTAPPSLETSYGPWSHDPGANVKEAYGAWLSLSKDEKRNAFNTWWHERRPTFVFVPKNGPWRFSGLL